MAYEIRDLITGETVTTDNPREAFRTFFPCCDSDVVLSAYDALFEALDRGQYAGGFENFLGIGASIV